MKKIKILWIKNAKHVSLIKLTIVVFNQLTPDAKQKDKSEIVLDKDDNVASQPSQKEEDNFFDLLSRFQSSRMDERCALNTKRNPKYRTITPEVSDMDDKYVKY